MSLIVGFIVIVYMAIQSSGSELWQSRDRRSYQVTAAFDDIGRLGVRAPIKMCWVRIGWVESVAYDPTAHKAVVTLDVQGRYDSIPRDSSAAIQAAGLLGGNYVAITPGGASVFLRAGARIESTHSAVGLENTITKLLSSFSGT
jgi:phospholipid/cholesterol/gamma-HCH transport system substrate-binding protein